MTGRRRVLVLGGRGLLGSHLSAELSRHLGDLDLVVHESDRFAGPADVSRYLTRHNPSLVINCLAYKGSDPAMHFIAHTGLARSVADWCAANSSISVMISTNAVFPPDDERRWLPSDAIRPSSPYEMAKAFGEDPRALVVRTSFVGHSPKGDGIWDTLATGRPYWDRRWNGVTALTLARYLADRVASSDVRPGVAHVHSPEPASFSEIARWLGSTSECLGWRSDARLLGGGESLDPLKSQVAEYLLRARTMTSTVSSLPG
jgi:dTDP-4-dehydrorhamnose reductase